MRPAFRSDSGWILLDVMIGLSVFVTVAVAACAAFQHFSASYRQIVTFNTQLTIAEQTMEGKMSHGAAGEIVRVRIDATHVLEFVHE